MRRRCWNSGVTPTAPTDGWQNSPFYHLIQQGGGELRCRLHAGETAGFDAIEELRADGQTDYFAKVHLFAPDAILGEMDNLATRWTTARRSGFTGDEIAALRYLTPILGLAIKSASLARVPVAVVETYLGRDAGRRVLQGRMSRGIAETLNAVLWFSDMRGYTTLSETISSDQLIPLLNDYAEAVISAVHGAGGDVLKLMGDGTLAIFTDSDPARACVAAMRAEADLRLRLAELNRRRASAGEPVSTIYLGLHVGDVFYGNIGSPDRLDFTVVGPGGQRGQPHRFHVPFRRPSCAVLAGVLRGPAGGGTQEAVSPSAAMRCAASAGRRNSSRSTLNSCRNLVGALR